MESKEILENAINAYEGTVLYVSHDRYFVNQTADKILELENHQFSVYLGNYDYFIQKKTERMAQEKAVQDAKRGDTESISDNLKERRIEAAKEDPERKAQGRKSSGRGGRPHCRLRRRPASDRGKNLPRTMWRQIRQKAMNYHKNRKSYRKNWMPSMKVGKNCRRH